MAVKKIVEITARGIPLFLDDIDTDRIIPARYLRCVTFEGLGEHAFEDDRQQDPQHPFNNSKYHGAGVLVAGRNFGCGSSREHAPQALMRWGIQAVVAESFAEIFFGNCIANGIPPVCADREHLQQLAATIEDDPELQVTVDLANLTVSCGDLKIPCRMQDGARQSLITGNWDFLSQLLEAEPQIRATAQKLPYVTGFAS